MNTEQYRQLKPGDNVLEYGVVERVGEENVQVGVKHSNGDKSCAWVSKEDVGAAWAVPSKPKYDPCRLFRKGDEVEYRPKDGRANPNLLVGRKYKVSADEPCDSGIVQVEFDGLRHLDTFVAYNNLELVTPVEELEPCFFHDEDEWEQLPYYTIYFGIKRNYELVSCLDKKYYTREQAEAERARLNAEYRKETE